MNKPIHASLVIGLLLMSSGCDSWVQGVDDPINLVPAEELAGPEDLAFVLAGLKGTFAETHDQLTVLAGGLSDEQVFHRDLPQATFPSYDRLERGEFASDDGTINDVLGELRFYADHLVESAAAMGDVTDEFQEDKREALFYAYFLGGVARVWYASYMALEPERGGGVIDNGPFIPSEEMSGLAVESMTEALAYATPYQERLVYSTMARALLYDGEYEAALSAARSGLTKGDQPFVSEHSIQSENEWYDAANEGRVQFRVDERFPAYVVANPEEVSRLPMWTIEGHSGTIWHIQDKYSERASSITFIDWQENHLMLAELGLRTGDVSLDPLQLVNEVRNSHGIYPLSSVDMDVIIEERDKELFGRGQRLVDQRRFGLWHLGPETWRYFPISQNERNNNPNL